MPNASLMKAFRCSAALSVSNRFFAGGQRKRTIWGSGKLWLPPSFSVFLPSSWWINRLIIPSWSPSGGEGGILVQSLRCSTHCDSNSVMLSLQADRWRCWRASLELNEFSLVPGTLLFPSFAPRGCRACTRSRSLFPLLSSAYRDAASGLSPRRSHRVDVFLVPPCLLPDRGWDTH